MLNSLHASVGRLIREHGGFGESDVDIRFEAPESAFIQQVTRPTICFFLCELSENVDLRQNSFQSARENGHAERRLPPRRIDLRYLIAVFTSNPNDEYTIIWRILATLMKHHELPEDVLSGDLRDAGVPVVTRTAQADDGAGLFEIQRALDLQHRPCLSFVVTAPLDLEVVIRSPLVLTSSLSYLRMSGEVPSEPSYRVGGVVRRASGEPVPGAVVTVEGRHSTGFTADQHGRFVLSNLSGGELSVRVELPGGATQSVELVVPADSYDIEIDESLIEDG